MPATVTMVVNAVLTEDSGSETWKNSTKPSWMGTKKGIMQTLFISHKQKKNKKPKTEKEGWPSSYATVPQSRATFQHNECVYKNTKAFNECTRKDNVPLNLHFWVTETIKV